MKLQLALDTVDLDGAKVLLDDLHGLVDLAEIGTPFVYREGLRAVTTIARAYPELDIVADLKIIDAGEYEAGLAFEAGADIVTVLGVAHDSTIRGVIDQARAWGKQVMADLIAAKDVLQRADELDAMGVDYLCVHTATDLQAHGQDPLDALRRVQPVLRRARIAVAGGVTPALMKDIVPQHPDIVIVGSFITRHDAPRHAAQRIRASFQ
ncbi:MAG: orotidine 5'-phosphate decarboxylase [Candidatus Latescibacteria bacterium]|nr:orotidine 5'-phosphate decarboxylase [Candidatus Latescibacterota bacterium]